MNIVIVSGRLARDPEIRTTSTGKAVGKATVVTNEWNGEKEVPEFHTVIAWEKLSDRLARGRKGAVVNVVGRLQTRKWKDASGADHRSTEIVASKIEVMGGPKSEENPAEDTELEGLAF